MPIAAPEINAAGRVTPGKNPPTAPAGPSAGPPPRTTARFVPVRPGELDAAPRERPARAWVSPHTWALVIGLLAVWLLAWYMLQPPSADGLYRRIQRQVNSESAEALEQAEDDIRQFLARFPQDPRSDGLRDYAQRIDMSHLERRLELQAKGVNAQPPLSPVERCYVDALNAARVDPETGIARFQAMIDLFGSPEDGSGPIGRCIQLAKRRLGEFRQQYDAQSQELLHLVEERIKEADELRTTDPERANAMYRAVLVLCQGKAWARTSSGGQRLRSGK